MKLRILSNQYGFTVLFVINSLIFNTIHAQSNFYCNIGAGTEPDPKTEIKSTSNVAEVFSPYFTSWNQLKNLKFSDERKATIILSNINRSRQILGNNLNFRIPKGATIHGISLIIEGQSDGFNKIDELQIQLTGMDGEPKGKNKKNTAKFQKAWSQNSNGSDKTWIYGSKMDTWGTQWTAEEINDPNFGYQIQIRNIVNDTVRVKIDQIYMVVDYTPAYSFCDDDCLTFHVDKFENFGSYVWDYPLGFELVSKSIYDQTIDLKITTAEFGLYTLCVDLYDYDGNFAQRCCREFLYQDCSSSQIKGMAWLDLNDNQMKENGEGILSNVPLILFKENNTSVDTVLTDQFGKYEFNNLIPGKYYIKAPNFNDKRIILFDPAIDPDNNSDVTNANGPGTTDLITTEVGNTEDNIDFGYTPLVSVGDFVWNDINFNGLQDNTEMGIANIKVKIFRQNGLLFDSIWTDTDGKYKFENIPGNKYFLAFDFPTGFLPTFSNNASTTTNSKINTLGRTPLFTFISPGFYKDIDAGFYKSATIGDLVWEDKNGNGLYDDAIEQGLAGVPVSLTGTAGDGTNVNLQTITDGNGRYLFDDVIPGTYSLNIAAPAGYEFTVPNRGDDTQDSDVIDGKIDDISLGSGDFRLNFDAGLYKPGSLGDFVWNDVNGDGIQQAGESGLTNVLMHLIEYLNADTLYIGQTETDSNGQYGFNNLKPGQYKISAELPDGFKYTLANVGSDDEDSDADMGKINDIILMSGENNSTYDIGMYTFGSIGDFVWEDLNGNGIQDQGEPGIYDVLIELTGLTTFGNNVSYFTTTDSTGKYLFDFLDPGDYTITVSLPLGYKWTVSGLGNNPDKDADGFDGILDISISSGTKLLNIDFGMYRFADIGDYVWEDSNGNGIQDTSESGIGDVEMQLEGEAGNGSMISMVVFTDAFGFYNISNVPPGNYTLTIDVPDEHNLTVGLLGNDTGADSDFDDDNNILISIISGQHLQTLDAGLVRNVAIGDFVWHDKNANGLQDMDETGISGIIVTLDGQTGTGINITQSTESDDNGFYRFGGVLPGNYNLTFVPVANYEFTLNDQGSDDRLDADPVNGIITNISASSGDDLDQYDAGFILMSSIGDFVWEDLNGNGMQDIGEPGISDAIISLSGTDIFGNTVLENAASDVNGNYLFEAVLPGNYTVNFIAPENTVPTIPIQGDPNLDSDPVNGLVSDILIISDEHRADIDAGYYRPSMIDGILWEDKNANGIREANEVGLANITLTITGSNGSVSMSTTDDNGSFNFGNLAPATYSLSTDLPVSYFWSVSNVGSDDLDSDFINGILSNIAIVSGSNINNIGGGMYRKVSIGDFAWTDSNFNGIQDTSEVGLQDVILALNGIDGSGLNVSLSTTSDENGAYLFDDLVPGAYNITASLPSGYTFTISNNIDSTLNSDGIQGVINNVVLCSNENRRDFDFGFVKSLAVGDFVWDDLNANGLQDAGEPGIANVNITLQGTTFDGTMINQSTVTNQNGKYEFSGILPGDYTILLDIPINYTPTITMAGIDASLDSDLSDTLAKIEFTLSKDDFTIDIGLVKFGSIGDFVWDDLNGNGIQDIGEPGISEAIITLSGTDIFGNAVNDTTSTDTNGNYSFDGLLPGNYNVNFISPENTVPTISGQGDPNLDSDPIDGLVNNIIILSNDHRADIDAGYYRPSMIDGILWEDKNANGIREANEVGLANITLTITGSNGSVSMSTTDDNGSFSFGNLAPAAYSLSADLPVSYFWSLSNVGSDDLDSDFINGILSNIVIVSGSNINNIGGGMYRKVSIGDFVWTDSNFNGIQDTSEVGLQDVILALNGIDGSGLNVSLSTTSDENGAYLFNDLVPGAYNLTASLPSGYTFTISNNIDSTLNSDGIQGVINNVVLCSNENRRDFDFGFVKSLAVGDFVWDDLNANGLQDAGEPGISNVNITLQGTTFDGTMITQSTVTNQNGKYEFSGILPGDYTILLDIPINYTPTLAMAGIDASLDSDLSETLAAIEFTLNEDDFTIDIGLIKLGSIGDLVWEDLNCNGIREQNEPGLEAVKVMLEGIDLFNTIVQSSTISDINGNYLFDQLKPGQYFVNFEAPSGYEFSRAMINIIMLNNGQQVLNMDAPFFRKAALGDFVWYDINENGIQDVNEAGAEGILVSLTGNTFTGLVNRDTLTDNTGRYYFDNLKPGEYQISVQLPENYEFSIQNAGSDNTLDSDVNADGLKSNIALISGEKNTGIDVGLSLIASAFIGDYVWEDRNFNGIQDANEQGMSGIEVKLSGMTLSGKSVSKSIFSDENGFYGFEDLEAGTYTIQFITVEPYLFTRQNQGSGDNDSDADPTSGFTNTIVLGATTHIENIDAGLYRKAFIGDFVWHDLNKNGLQEIGEPGILGIKMNLLDSQDNLIVSTMSMFNGLYFFVNLDPGDYRLEAEISEIYIPTIENNISAINNSDFKLQDGSVLTDLFTITSNGSRLDLDLGLADAISSISGCAFADDNGNGLKDNMESLKEGILVYLLSSNNDTLAIDTTAINGLYSFDNLNPGDYQVAFEVLEDSLFTYLNVGNDRNIDNDADKFTGKTFNIMLPAGQTLAGINAGYVGFSAIGDFLWRDDNEDGLQSTGEPGINGIKVVLLDNGGSLVDSTTTSLFNGSMRGGFYRFDRLPYDDYTVKFILRENLDYTVNVPDENATNSDVVNLIEGSTALFPLLPNQFKDDIDAGYILTAPISGSITGVIWQDANNNKVKDAVESILPGISVSLFDLSNNLLNTAVSDQTGRYLFENVPFGDYYITSEMLSDFVFVEYSGQSIPFDSDITNEFSLGSTRLLTVFPGETIENIDLGYARKISIGDFVWDDLNHNGLQDINEPGLMGINVFLINEADEIEKTTTSDSNGNYQFTDVAVGKYTLEFVLPATYLYTINNNSNPVLNSKANQDSGKTALLDFTTAQTYSDIDAGFVRSGSIGDNVWLDLNGNGIFQSGEPGISDIAVTLFKNDGTKISETITKVDPSGNFVGFFQFTNVRPGNYYIHFGIPSIYLLSPSLIGNQNTDNNITSSNGPNTTDIFTVGAGQLIDNIDAGAYLPATIGDFVWNDLNQDGTQNPDEPGVADITVRLFTQAGQLLDTKVTDLEGKYAFTSLRQRLYYLQFSLPDGFQFTQQYNSTNGATDSDVDATGTTPLISLAHGTNFLDIDAGIHVTTSNLIMGTVWDDKNEDGIRTENEKFQNNVVVQLKDDQNQILHTFTTNHAGMYCVSSNEPGEHHIQVVNPLSYLFTIKNAGNDRSMDSDVDENGISDPKMFDANYELEHVDAGMYFKLTGNIKGLVWLDTNGNGIRDDFDPNIENVVIFLFNKNRVFIKSVKTDNNGFYNIKNIESGQYYCMIPEFPNYEFVMFTGNNQDKDSEITNQYGAGTSRLLTIQGGIAFENFDFGYKPIVKFNKQVEVNSGDIQIYPNPTLYSMQIALPKSVKYADYYIVNNMGSVIQQGKIRSNDKNNVNTEFLPTGKYTLHVISDESNWMKPFLKISN